MTTLHLPPNLQNWLPEKPSRIAVGMSGGVDSSVVAHLLVAAGHEVVGLTAWTLNGPGTCCNDALVNAGRVCEELNIPFDTVDLRAEFFHYVMDYYNKSYEAGTTPNPCVECNRYVKWEKFMGYAQETLDVEYVATGHYINLARPKGKEGGFKVLKAADPTKDQTYMLARVFPKELNSALFPLGGWLKKDVLAYANEKGIINRSYKESVDICFVLDGQANYLKQTLGIRKGNIVDVDSGKVLGEHDGHWLFTKGQRRGVNVAAGRPVYVIRTEPKTNTVFIGDKHHLESSQFTLKSMNWLDEDFKAQFLAEGRLETLVKVRYAGEPTVATLLATPDAETFTVELAEPASAVTAGQIAAFYTEDNVQLLGGGFIEVFHEPKPFDAENAPPLPDLNASCPIS
jgi:tRNA-specific 2-thiouridylase